MTGKFSGNRKNRLNLAFYAAAVIFLCAFLAGCGSGQKQAVQNRNQMYICYLNSEEDGLEKVPYEGEFYGTQEMCDAFLDLLRSPAEKENYSALLPSNVKIQRIYVEDGILIIDFSKEYEEMEEVREVLVRAGFVRTFVQIEGISAVRFTVNGGVAKTRSGKVLGNMNADSFVEDAGKQINAIQHATINLYFSNESGTALKKEARSIYYSASKPLEWAVVERIIAGPKVEGNYPTVPGNTQIISVSSSNGICYVNLTQSFITNALSIADEKIPIYSIVNSITDNSPDIQAVQIAVDGESNQRFRSETDLSQTFKPDLTYVEE